MTARRRRRAHGPGASAGGVETHVRTGAPPAASAQARSARAIARDVQAFEMRLIEAEALGAAIPALRLVRTLGAGATGRVHLAEHRETGALVAVKVLRSDLAASPAVRARFLREATAARRIDHPAVVRLLDATVVRVPGGHLPVLVLEHVPGPTLAQRLRTGTPLGERAARRIGARIADALGAVHAAGVVHRDVKPSNIAFDARGRAKLLDLGVARIADAATTLTRTGGFVGTIVYAAPEQFDATVGAVDARTDLFALGVTLFETVTGRIPWVGAENAPRAAVLRVSDVRLRVSAAFDDLVASLLATAPDDRPATAAVVAARLRATVRRHAERSRAEARAATGRRAEVVEAVASAAAGRGRVVVHRAARASALRDALDRAARRIAEMDPSWRVVRASFDGAPDAVRIAVASLTGRSAARRRAGSWHGDAAAFALCDAVDRESLRRPVAFLFDRIDAAAGDGLADFAALVALARDRRILIVAGCLGRSPPTRLDDLLALPHVRAGSA